MKQIALVWLLGACFALGLSAQSAPRFFQPVAESDIVAARGAATTPNALPSKYQTWRLDFAAMKLALKAAPMEFTAAARKGTCTIAIPTASGAVEDFSVWETAMMEPELAARYPDIRTYAGQSLSNPGRTVRLSSTLRGFQAMIMRPDLGVEYVKTYTADQQEYYIAYDRVDEPVSLYSGLTTGVMPGAAVPLALSEQPYAPAVESRGELLEPVKLRVYRYAVSCTGEFGLDHGGTVPLALSAVVEYTNEVNAAFERDIAMRFQLVANNDKVIFVDPVTDPFSGTEAGQWLGQNPGVLNTVITPAKYDLGHVYARYMGGSAAGVAGAIGNACASSTKGEGCSTGNLVGNTGRYEARFLIVIGQEVGHQMGGGHTWNRCNGGGGRQGISAFEPGSGSTIMSYGGSCGSDNVQNYSDLYYHAGSIEEIKTYYVSGPGSGCGSYLETTNTAPTVTLPYTDGFYIPISTYFELDGSAIDPDGDKMSYSWEEMDAGPEVPLGEPSGDAAIFRTWLADTVNTYRYFPRIQTIISGASSIVEQLPTYTRPLTFRLTARDNRPNGGGVGWADVAFRATDEAGPFRVSYPNANGVSWRVGEYANVTWEVANTDRGLVNCKKVNIRLSTDGGKTYPIMLAEGVTNDGSQYVLVPSNLSLSCRIRVDGADNVFFDISNSNFRILNPVTPTLSLGLSTDAAQVCQPGLFSTQVLTAGTLGFSTPVALSVQQGGLPAESVVSLDKTTLNPGEQANLVVDMSQVPQSGIYTFQVKAVAIGTTDTLLRPITLTYYTNNFSGLALQSPADGTNGMALSQTVRWSLVPDATLYDVQVSTTPSFAAGTIIASKSNVLVDTFKIPVLLEKSKAYYWRVRPKNECGEHDWTEAFFFSTFVESCSTFGANDLPKFISASGTPTVESQITLNAGGTIKSMNVKQLKGSHTFFKDLDVRLISPKGTEVTLFKNRCGGLSISYDIKLDDNALSLFTCPPGNMAFSYRPETPLSAFVGENSTGTWVLRVKDTQSSSGGTIDALQLEFCAAVTLNPPFLVNNNTLSLLAGTDATVSSDLLRVDDANNTHSQLLFTLVSVPQNGELRLNGTPLAPGAQFSQAQIDSEALRYYDAGGSNATDGFRFIATDNEGGFVATPKFKIQPMTVGTHEPGQAALTFGLFPNPADESVWVTFEGPVESKASIQVFNTAGQVVQSATVAQGNERLQLHLASLPQGVYIVQVESEAGVGAQKLVVK